MCVCVCIWQCYDVMEAWRLHGACVCLCGCVCSQVLAYLHRAFGEQYGVALQVIRV